MVTAQLRRSLRPRPLQTYCAVAAVAAVLGVSAPAAAQDGCRRASEPADPIPGVPWAQTWFDPARVHSLSDGDGVRVAVVDTGVDATHRQLADGQVLEGADLLPEPLGGRVDCDGHGTAVASLIAASRVDGTGFFGLAPGAEILPVRVADQQPDSSGASEQLVDAETLADAIRWATDHDADVINLSIVFYRDHRAIADAVQEALDEDVVVVAAVGNPITFPNEVTPYPAGYEGVLGVGAIGYDSRGDLTTSSYVGPEVDLVAPGVLVTAAAAGGDGHLPRSGSSFAAPLVSAAAALVRAADRELTGAEVVDRLLATADYGPGSRDASGYGVVNPYRALTERPIGGAPVAATAPHGSAPDPAAVARAQRWRQAVTLALVITGGALGFGALAVAGRTAWRRGQRLHWRSTRRPEQPERATVDAPERVFFTVPTARERG